MIFNIAPQNTEKAKRAFTTARPAHVYGYTKSAILTPKNPRMIFSYQIDQIHDIIVCTIRHQEAETVEAVITARAFTDNSIEIERAELYRNASNYPYRTETADRYMRKYDQIACIVHGAIAAGLLFDTVEAPTTEETSEAVQDTTYTDREPQETTETAQREPETVTCYIVQCRSKRRPWTDYSSPATLEECEQIKERAEARHVLNQNGEPIMYRIAPATTPNDKTTGDHTTQTAHSATEQTETTEAEHVPTATQTEPPRATDASTTGIAGRTTGATTPPRHACTVAPGRTERHEAEHVPTAHAKSPPRATQQAATSRAHALPESYFFRQNAENRSIFPEIFEGPIFYMLVSANLARFLSGPYRAHPLGVSKNKRTIFRRKIFQSGGKQNGQIYDASY